MFQISDMLLRFETRARFKKATGVENQGQTSHFLAPAKLRE